MWLDNHPKDATKSLLILDTEGLNHVSGASEVDIWIFILSILLSTVFVYNQSGVIDANSVHGLKLACDLTDHVKSKTSSGMIYIIIYNLIMCYLFVPPFQMKETLWN